ncbi:MAG: hypothetical protein U0L51_07905 [Olegusella sp.]|nr:hypothetical protein [Olegusella sp.]
MAANLSNKYLERIAEMVAPRWEKIGGSSSERDPVVRGQSLSAAAMILLAYASRDGEMHLIGTMSGTTLTAGGQEFIRSQEGREIALWEGAVDELERLGLIKSADSKGEAYKLTSDGYAVADVVIGENKIDLGRSPAEYFDD